MTILEATGYQYPEHWYETFEACSDGGYGYKLGEYQQLVEATIVQEMQEVKDGKRQPEAHHNTIMAAVDSTESTDEFIEALEDYIWNINAECKGDFE